MKKFLALVLAVICIFSMATVAFAATIQPNRFCDACGTEFTTDEEFRTHVETACDRVCSFCNNTLETNESKANHEKKCLKGVSDACDYCGKTFTPIADYDDHLEACKAKYYNIPVAKIVATIKDLFSKIDWSSVLGTVKDLGGKLGGLLGNIGK